MPYRETSQVRERKTARRERLLRAVWELVGERGFEQVRMVDVAARAGLATGTVYRYFGSRGELFAAVFQRATALEVEHVRQALADTSGTAADGVEAALRTFARRAMRAPVLAWSLMAEPVDPRVEQARLVYRRSYARLFQTAIERGIGESVFPPQPAGLSANAVVGALAEALAGPLAPGRDVDHQAGAVQAIALESMIDTVVRFCMQGLTGTMRTVK
ncbi:MAG: TetR/AcrR family transcriptional regulator [Wenzhouxiangella sp.]|nr:MAG: TetR/AcrR family transcriptional regulator [Wenzhouxiangella sp.]